MIKVCSCSLEIVSPKHVCFIRNSKIKGNQVHLKYVHTVSDIRLSQKMFSPDWRPLHQCDCSCFQVSFAELFSAVKLCEVSCSQSPAHILDVLEPGSPSAATLFCGTLTFCSDQSCVNDSCLPLFPAFSLEGSGISFADLFRLVAFYCISR